MNEMEKLLTALEEVDEDIDFTESDHLIDDGVINSLMLTQIIAALNDTFDIRIRTGEVEPENFQTVPAMMDLVNRCREKSC